MDQGEHNDNAVDAVSGLALGIGDGIRQVVEDKADLAARMIMPGDQRRIPHPVDDFAADVSGAWRAVTTPADMNIKHSAHPVDVVVNAHSALVSATADNFAEKGVAQGVRELSALVTVAAIENMDPFKKIQLLDNAADVANIADTVANVDKASKVLQTGAELTPLPIDWNTYEHLLGYGSQPPKLKPLRDFSGLMDYRPPGAFDVASHLVYEPYPNHKILMYLEHQRDEKLPPNIVHTKMDFVVRAQRDLSQEAGTGSEMFHSGMSLIQHYGVKIQRIDGNWSEDGDLSTNYHMFANARAQGLSIKESISQTPTGRWVADAGFTEVGGWHFNSTVHAPNLPAELHPEFTRPVFSDHHAYNTYGNAWASSQGRSRIDLVSRHEDQSGKLPTSVFESTRLQ